MESYKRIVFHHIPKTAGQSVTTQLRSYFRDTDIYNSTNIDSSDINSSSFDNDFLSKKLICGHIWSPIPTHLLESSFVFTFFRNPYDQLISNVNHVLREKQNSWHKALAHFGHNIALRELAYVFCNHQARCCHRFLYEDADAFERREGYDSPFILERVMERIERYSFIGTVERFDISSCIIGDKVGVSFDGEFVKNASPKKNEISFNFDEFFPSNSLDVSLYREVSNRLERMTLDFRNKQIVNNSLPIRSDKQQGLSKNLNIYFGPGWSESVPYNKTESYRWIVSKNGAYFSFTADQNDLIISINIINSHIDVQNDLELIMEDISMPFSVSSTEGEITVHTSISLQEPSGVHSILIKTKNWKSFYEIDNSVLDLTPRSIAVSNISIKNNQKSEKSKGRGRI